MFIVDKDIMLRLRTAVATTLCGLLLSTPSFAGNSIQDYVQKAVTIVMKDGKKESGKFTLAYKPRSNDSRIRKRIPSSDYDLVVLVNKKDEPKTLQMSIRKPGKTPNAYFRDFRLNGIKKRDKDFAWFQMGKEVTFYNKENSKKINQFYLISLARFVSGYYPFLNKRKKRF
jgi:hypothetical protein